MADFVLGTFWICCLGCFIYFSNGCAERQTKSQIIVDKGFCVEARDSGVEFKKCYELREKD